MLKDRVFLGEFGVFIILIDIIVDKINCIIGFDLL